MDSWSDIVPTALRAPIMLYKHRNFIKYWSFRALTAVGRGRSDVIVLGRAAVGKSMLVDRLGELPGGHEWNPPDPSRDVETAVLRVGAPIIIRTIPGQLSRERDEGLHRAFHGEQSIVGAIYVCDWGYTDIRDPAQKRDLIENRGFDTLAKMRRTNLEAELSDFERFLDEMRSLRNRSGKPEWIIVVCNKADLFYDEIDAAQRYYHPDLNSPFAEVTQRFFNSVGRENLKFDVIPVSSIHDGFEWNGEKIRPQTSAQEERILMNNLLAIIKRNLG